MYLYLAMFWFAVGVLVQVFWETLKDLAFIPVSREVMGFIFFVLFSFNFLRWRMARARDQASKEMNEPPPRPRIHKEPIDPTFDFSDPKDGDKK